MCLKSIVSFVKSWGQVFASIIQTRFMSSIEKDIEIATLRSQLALCQQKIVNNKILKPIPTPAFRQLWVLISKFFSDWESYLLIVKPETVTGWHRKAFKFYWTKKSKKPGRPPISPETIAHKTYS